MSIARNHDAKRQDTLACCGEIPRLSNNSHDGFTSPVVVTWRRCPYEPVNGNQSST